ncbi:diacylglycerol kinase (ATP) [Streptoalloteichus tenebrarius]|uniref:Diacylglycerol kinase (ATP) n=1 Tax=Streptoalloteichus tenebrarius (strain ATCC 17920 / DSM 40477 / JCM 4838 / CBS 697.72 / NBRC 16177 / NCIMB 11028 / NRRL B-12390 / A12253. 1 / ISP 5477) TaxID=1933 RepID=A0ABT1HPA4_STRSD|nr:diacylglycerol kinase family protein [Streptoalloteichus tenebrarius]MCP2257336.1 diacylglycerol kinase (ATP) [Streptoalloteichus tenebrarius]BFF04245.1 YegS/Rv2252/BmrU family lipid kinase [Streptoalloteichus tenebrarius]
MRTVLLVNPVAANGAAARVAGSVAHRLREAATDLAVKVAGTADATTGLALRAVADGADVVAVLGGDGSAHAALQACAGTGTALAVIPAGTGNDLAAALDLPSDPLAAAEVVASALRERRRRRMDLGRISGGGWFATVLCAGFDAAVNERANAMRWPRGPRRYDLAILLELARLGPRPLVVDSAEGRLELEATLVAVGNTDRYGGGIPICPDADPTDGWFDLTVVGRASRAALVRILPRLRDGHHVDHPAVTTLRARSVHLGGQNGWVAYADGERQARLPLTVRCEPGALSVVV